MTSVIHMAETKTLYLVLDVTDLAGYKGHTSKFFDDRTLIIAGVFTSRQEAKEHLDTLKTYDKSQFSCYTLVDVPLNEGFLHMAVPLRSGRRNLGSYAIGTYPLTKVHLLFQGSNYNGHTTLEIKGAFSSKELAEQHGLRGQSISWCPFTGVSEAPFNFNYETAELVVDEETTLSVQYQEPNALNTFWGNSL